MSWKKYIVDILFILLIWYGDVISVSCLQEIVGRSDFVESKVLSRIAFGSCMNGMFNQSKWHQGSQPVWKHIMTHKPDLWIWLGDAAYADTQIAPFLWRPSPLPLMAKYFSRQKNNPDYQKFIKSGVTVIGVWDDHDYGLNDGGMHFHSRLQTQDIYLDFINEPLDSLRRKREGLYISYTYGHGDKAVKLILLDVRSFAVYGSACDLLGSEQWKWLMDQLNDPTPVALTIVTSGIQILSNSPTMQNWADCPRSYDRLIWLTRQRDKVIYLSGDVHFGEMSCLNSSSSGYPIYEVTSSGLYIGCSVAYLDIHSCSWLLRNMFAHDARITEPVVERNFGIVEINWDVSPAEIKLQIFGQENTISKEIVIRFSDIEKQWIPPRCPDVRPKLAPYKFYLFLSAVGFMIIIILALVLISLYFIGKISVMAISKLVKYFRVTKLKETKEKTS